MKRLQILIEDELLAELDRVAGKTGRSKSALIREYIRKHIRQVPPFDEDPLFSLAGYVSFPPADIDSTLYGATKGRSHSRGRGSRVKPDRRR
jgi:ribbon-helix-helix CopG family protein